MSAVLEAGWAKRFLGHQTRDHIAAERVLDVVSQAFELSTERLVRRERRHTAEQLEARRIAMLLLREFTTLSFPRIAIMFGFTDHTSVMYHCERVRFREQYDDDYATVLFRLREALR